MISMDGVYLYMQCLTKSCNEQVNLHPSHNIVAEVHTVEHVSLKYCNPMDLHQGIYRSPRKKGELIDPLKYF